MPHALRSGLLLLALIGGEAAATSHSLGIERKQYGESIAYDMNAAGQVAAVIKEKDGTPHAVFFENGKLIKLELPGETESEAKRINDKGEVVGSSKKDQSWRAFIRSRDHGTQELGTLGGPSSYGAAINNAGLAVGFADTPNRDWHAFLYTPGEALKDLGTLGGKVSYASGINNLGQVTGTAMIADGSRHAFFYDSARGMVDLGTIGGRYSSATAINDKGVVVGASETKDRRWHAFVHDGSKMVDLGDKIGFGDSFATGINNEGHVVGVVDTLDMRLSFVWRDNKMVLHPAGKSLYLTNAINNTGQVIGASYDRGLYAATMPSNAIPFVDLGGTKILGFNVLVVLLALGLAIFRKRLKGLFFESRLFFGA
ncbi:HAF repeat-containing protein [Undibacterium sp. CY18W]|uniref:HAF repeat-containing protein n=1 Tax=Undibacterium hunanense TaxID=2762292 RepID=A0ABR6ZL96_9BURK|nr:HAF repeat-containing protein [Undibacterium hunanense]MBC3916669.1 HAF repeat-containing protein [Undibacterium hunanense]